MTIQNNFPAIKPSLNLDFANTKQLDPRITFARASTARFYDGKTTAKAEENLLLQSQAFEAAGWGLQTGSTVTSNTTVAPDGTTTADTFNEGTGSAYHDVEQTLALPVGAITVSCYMKYVDQQYGIIALSTSSSNYMAASFDLVGGTVSASSNSGTVTTLTGATITAVGGGWYRCTVSGTVVTANSFVVRLAIAPTGTIGIFGIGTYTGTSKTAIFWGAQLEQRSSATAYTPTTTAPITNYIPVLQTATAGTPRFDHNPVTGESLGLLIEEQRTNLLTYSEQFDNAYWNKIESTISANQIIAPDGTLTADKILTTTANNVHVVFKQSLVSSGSITLSVYAKAGEYSWLFMGDTNSTSNGANFNLTTGALGTIGSNATATITPSGNGWYRCTVTTTASAGSGMGLYVQNANNVISFVGNGTSGIYIWGAQLEAGAFATSYIPTVASQVTRAADSASITGSNFSSWYNQTSGTVYAAVRPIAQPAAGKTARFLEINDGTANGRNPLLFGNNAAGIVSAAAQYRVGGVTQASLTAVTNPFLANTLLTVASAYSQNNFAASFNGTSAVTDSSGSGSVLSGAVALDIGYARSAPTEPLNGTISRIAYYPIRCTNTQLQSLTS